MLDLQRPANGPDRLARDTMRDVRVNEKPTDRVAVVEDRNHMSQIRSPESEIVALQARLHELAETGTLREIERAAIELRLARLGTVPKAARSLGTSLPTLYKKVRHYRMDAVRRSREDRTAAAEE